MSRTPESVPAGEKIDGVERLGLQRASARVNCRDLSKEQRDRFIACANATARRLPPVATPSSGTASRRPVSSKTEGASFESRVLHLNRTRQSMSRLQKMRSLRSVSAKVYSMVKCLRKRSWLWETFKAARIAKRLGSYRILLLKMYTFGWDNISSVFERGCMSSSARVVGESKL